LKKRHGLARALPVVRRDDLEQLSTGSLLARLRRLRWCEENSSVSDLTPEEIDSAADRILFKSDEAWHLAFNDLKEVLAGRENFDRKI
jgi:hypothetical protein